MIDFEQPNKMLITSKSANNVPFYLMQVDELEYVMQVIKDRMSKFDANSINTGRSEREQYLEYTAAWQNALYNLQQKQ